MTISNVEQHTVKGFGQEWSAFNQPESKREELGTIFEEYFDIFPWSKIGRSAVGMDVGCGSGRWAREVAPRVGALHCIDASEDALEVARTNLSGVSNCYFIHSSVSEMPIEDNSLDFGYSLGVLHHVPDTLEGIKACSRKLKSGAPFLLYLYYSFDNRPTWFRLVWRVSDRFRKIICRLPFPIRKLVCDVLAFTVYYPLARTAKIAESLGGNVSAFPLSAYRDRTIYAMRTDSLDRFGTRLEQRFSAKEIKEMMEKAGFKDISFSKIVFWCAVGYKS
jgi:ubiquinone/menaquinone biosynthesis C-methylase UbiE